MKRSLIFAYILFFSAVTVAQELDRDQNQEQTSKPKIKAKQRVYTWTIDERFGLRDSAVVDTLITSYPDNNPVDKYSIANSWNGNLGSPLQSKIFFRRTEMTDNLFSRPYDAYLINPENLNFFNTRTPFSHLVYRSALPKYHEEDYFKAMLAINANKRLNFGGLLNYIYGRGQYDAQASKTLNGGVWSSYDGKRYGYQAMVMFNSFKNKENGGLSNPLFITDPEQIPGANQLDPWTIPVNLSNAESAYSNSIYYFNHHYSLGFEKERQVTPDSVTHDFIPVTSFIHSLKFEDTRKRYNERSGVNKEFYDTAYYNNAVTNDSARYWSLKNTFAITLEEKFNRLFKFGLAGFVEYDLRGYYNRQDTIGHVKYLEHHLKVGGILSKREGENFKFDVKGDVAVLGPHAGEVNLNGNIYTSFRISKDTVLVTANGGFKNFHAENFEARYYSNHFIWENDFSLQQKVKVGGRLSLPKRGISLGVNFENLTNPIYFNNEALPQQHMGNVQVLGVDAMINLKAWRIHLDNQLFYQLSSNKDILPLPDLSLYSNLYYKDNFFKVLNIQLGVSVRYNTAYYAPAYMPATGVFYNQNKELIGNYPLMNVYANFHVKRLRFYAQYAHFNKGLFGINNYFSMPNYPVNPATFQFGLSWTFYD